MAQQAPRDRGFTEPAFNGMAVNTSMPVLWGGQGLGTNQTILSVMGEKKMTDGRGSGMLQRLRT